MDFIICIPAYNEEKIILETVNQLIFTLAEIKNVNWKIVVADNASTDKTREVVQSIIDNRVNIFSLNKKGKGHAVIETAKNFKADFYCFIDADLSSDPLHIIDFLDIIFDGQKDVVIGSRFKDRSLVTRGMLREFTSKFFNILQMVILGLEYKDTQCGLKVMNNRGIDSLTRCREQGWFFDLEFLSICKENKVRVFESAVRWNEFHYVDRKAKLNIFKDGVLSIVAMFRIKFRLINEKRSF